MGKFYGWLLDELILFVRQVAWLNTAPDRKHGKREPRIKAYRDRGQEPDYPPCDAHFLADWLFEVGPTAVSGMGETPITHAELRHWQENTGIELSSWQARAIRTLSEQYLAQSIEAASESCPPPYSRIEPEIRAKVPSLVKSVLRG